MNAYQDTWIFIDVSPSLACAHSPTIQRSHHVKSRTHAHALECSTAGVLRIRLLHMRCVTISLYSPCSY